MWMWNVHRYVFHFFASWFDEVYQRAGNDYHADWIWRCISCLPPLDPPLSGTLLPILEFGLANPFTGLFGDMSTRPM